MMNPTLSPATGTSSVPPKGYRDINRAKNGTSLNNAVVLEREKNRKNEQQQNQQPPAEKHDAPLQIYNQEATAEDLGAEKIALSIVA